MISCRSQYKDPRMKPSSLGGLVLPEAISVIQTHLRASLIASIDPMTRRSVTQVVARRVYTWLGPARQVVMPSGIRASSSLAREKVTTTVSDTPKSSPMAVLPRNHPTP